MTVLNLRAFVALACCAVASAQTPPAPRELTAAAGVNATNPSSGSVRKAEKGIREAIVPVSLLSVAPTPSPAESFALNGNLAYVCGDNEVTVVDITNSQNLQVAGTALSSQIRNSGLVFCSVQRNSLVVFADQVSTIAGNNPGFVAFNLNNPVQPQLIAATPISKRFFQRPVFLGNFAFVPTAATTYFLQTQWDGQFGDLLTVDLNNFASPSVIGSLEQPQLHAQYGGAAPVFGAAQADTSLLYLGGTTSTSNQNNGTGRLQVVDVANPAATKVVGQVMVPGTVHFSSPVLQATVAVGIGNTGGFVGSINAVPATKGKIVVASFDVTDRRTPTLLSTIVTDYIVGIGGGATRIGNNLFAFAGVADASNNPVLLVVDVTDPKKPVINSLPIGQPFTSIQAVGSILYATLGTNGFATYSIPGDGSTTLSCPASLDAMLVIDRGTTLSSNANAKTALKSFIDSLHLTSDRVGVVTFDSAATLSQSLSADGPAAKQIVDTLLPSTNSYVGAGIAAAQTELTGPRHSASATPVMLVVSNGADAAAPNGSATLTAANAAKAAGIRIIALQFGSSTNSTMQSIASSAADYYQVSAP